MSNKVVLYARVSTSRQAQEGYSLRQQLEALREYAEREGYRVLEEVVDDGWSGGSLDRPGIDRIRELVEGFPGGVDLVLAQDGDRFSRDPIDHALLKQDLKENGCQLRALTDVGDDSPEGELSDGVLQQIRKYQRTKIRQSTRRGILQKVREGQLLRSRHPNYGFRFDEAGKAYEVEPEQMATVRRVIESVAAGKSLGEVARTLNDERISTATGKVGRDAWSLSRLREFVMEDVYRPHTDAELQEMVERGQLAREVADRWVGRSPGIFWFGRKLVKGYTVRVDGKPKKRQSYEPRDREDWIAIPVVGSGIPREAIDRARGRVRENRSPAESKSIERLFELSGVFYCASCGRRMATNNVRRGEVVHSYYRCPRGCYSASDCPNSTHHRAENVERWAWEYVGGVFSRPHLVEQAFEGVIQRELKNAGRDPEPERRRLLAELQRTEQAAERWQEMYAEGEISRERLRGKLAEQREKREGIQSRLREVERRFSRVDALRERRRGFMEHTEALRDRIESMHQQGATEDEIRNVFWMWRSSPTERNDLYRELGLRLEAAPGGDLQATFDFDPEKSIPDALLDAKRAALEHNAVVPDDSHSQG